MTKHDDSDKGAGDRPALPDQFISEICRDSGVPCDDQSAELPESIRDSIAKMQERWNNRLVWNTLDIAKEYIAGRLMLYVAVDAEAGFEFDVTPSARAGNEGDIFTLPSRPVREVEKLDAFDCGGLNDGGEDSVLFCIVELAKPVEQFSGPLRVDCKLSEEILGRLEGCYYSFARGFEIDPVVPGRKLCVPVLRALVEASKLPSGVVQSSAKVVDGVAEDQAHLGGKRTVRNRFKEQGAGLRVTVDMNSVSVSLSECLKSRLKITDVMIGPFDL